MTKDEALKIALETLEYAGPSWIDARQPAITAIKEAMAQPAQEPVAWRNAAIRVGEDLCSVGPFGYYDMTAEQWLDWALSVVTVHAPPAQRKPLTDEEVEKCYETTGHYQTLRPQDRFTVFALARAIEAAHGIKGEA